MIRIRNIAREVKSRRHRDDIVHLPGGSHVRVRDRREVTVDYATYLLNSARIILPGEPVKDMTNFRVVAGVEEIMRNRGLAGNQAETPAPITDTPQPPASIVSEPTKTPLVIEDADGAGSAMGTEQYIAVKDKDAGAATKVAPSTSETPEGAPGEGKVVPAEDTAAITVETTPKYTHEELQEKTHKELDELLFGEGITVPPRSSKTTKIEALLRRDE